MVATAFRIHIALVRWPVRVRDCVVDIAVDGLGVAGRCGAGLAAGAEQVLELAAGDVAVFCVGVVAGVPGDGFQSDVQAAEEAE